MPEPETQAQSGTTAARQMLAALTRTSLEISKKFSEGCEYVSRLNQTLENKVNGQLSEINERSEQIVRLQLQNLSAEKEAVIAELTGLRREELKVLQTIVKDLRDALSQRLQELVAGLKEEIEEKLSVLQDSLVQTETEVSLSVADLREVLNDRAAPQITSIQEKSGECKKELETLQEKHRELLDQQASESLDLLANRSDEFEGHLNKHGSEYLAAVDALCEKLLAEQQERLAGCLQSLATIETQAGEQLKTSIDPSDTLLTSFESSCRQVSEVRASLHKSMASNLAMLYRTEILSMAREIQDDLSVIRSSLQSVLALHRENYAEQAKVLLANFEKEAKLIKPDESALEAMAAEDLPAEVRALFEKLKQESADKVKEITAACDKKMEEALAAFRTRLSESSQNMCKICEDAFTEFRKDISESCEANKAMLEELNQKTDALEQLVDESKELMSVLDQSNLDF